MADITITVDREELTTVMVTNDYYDGLVSYTGNKNKKPIDPKYLICNVIPKSDKYPVVTCAYTITPPVDRIKMPVNVDIRDIDESAMKAAKDIVASMKLAIKTYIPGLLPDNF
jgi:hypothetical protein